MALFTNVFFDALMILMIILTLSEIVIPLWFEKPFFPSVRKLKTIIRKTKENVRQNNSNNNHVSPPRGPSEPGEDG